MKIIKIKEDHYVIVDNSPKKENFYIPIGTKYLDDTNTIREPISEDIDYWSARKDYCIITHSTQPLASMKELMEKGYDNILPLDIDEVKELIGEVDKAVYHNMTLEQMSHSGHHDFVKGYNQALEDNKEKKYTEKDLKRAHHYGLMNEYGKCDDVIKRLQPKTEWEVEIVDGKLKLVWQTI